jgi:hypothetical protein
MMAVRGNARQLTYILAQSGHSTPLRIATDHERTMAVSVEP